MPPSGFRKLDLADGKRQELACRVVHVGSNFSNGILSLPLEIRPA